MVYLCDCLCTVRYSGSKDRAMLQTPTHSLRLNKMRPSDRYLTNGSMQSIFTYLVSEGTGNIEWEEFSDFMGQLKMSSNPNQNQMEEMVRAFKLFDYNNDNHIDASELLRVVTTMGDPLTVEEANQMIKVADIDKDGRINYHGNTHFNSLNILLPAYVYVHASVHVRL